MDRSKSSAKRPVPDQADAMSAEELAAANLAWQRRCERIPAKFGSYEGYLQAVENGLFAREPKGHYKQLSERELRQQIEAAKTEPMPPWKPRPEGPSKLCLLALANFYNRDDEDDD